MDIATTLKELGVSFGKQKGADLPVYSPIDGSQIASMRATTVPEVETRIRQAVEAFTV